MNAFRNILVDVDASAVAQPALAWAASLARRTRARLRLVHVVSEPGDAPSGLRPDLHEHLVRIRREQLARLAGKSHGAVSGVDVLSGPPAHVLIREVEDHGHDLIVRHHHRTDTAGHRTGPASIDVELFRRSPCAVLAVGHKAMPPRPHVAVALDVEPMNPVKDAGAKLLVDVGMSFASALGGSLSLLHAWQPSGDGRGGSPAPGTENGECAAPGRAEAMLTLAALADQCEGHQVTRRLTVQQGAVAEVLPAFVASEGVDLLVVGTAGRRGVTRWLQGNTAEQLLERVSCSVLAVKVPSLVLA